jgi:hypothetical protein
MSVILNIVYLIPSGGSQWFWALEIIEYPQPYYMLYSFTSISRCLDRQHYPRLYPAMVWEERNNHIVGIAGGNNAIAYSKRSKIDKN